MTQILIQLVVSYKTKNHICSYAKEIKKIFAEYDHWLENDLQWKEARLGCKRVSKG
jgi:hypothetical protein